MKQSFSRWFGALIKTERYKKVARIRDRVTLFNYYEKINELERLVMEQREAILAVKPSFRITGTYSFGALSYLPHFVEPDYRVMTTLEFGMLNRTVREIRAERKIASEFFIIEGDD